jgi:nitrate reductase (cytochrome)
MLGDLFGRRDLRITSLWCMGMNQHTRGTAINCLVHGIHLLSGHFGRPGDAPTSLTGQPSACGTVREVGTLCHCCPAAAGRQRAPARRKLWNVPRGRIIPDRHHTVRCSSVLHPFARRRRGATSRHALGAGDQPRPDAAEPAQAVQPQAGAGGQVPDRLGRLSDRDDALADLILPSAMWVEKNGMYGNSERRTQQWFKMVEPPGEARDDCWQTIAVAHRCSNWGTGHEGQATASSCSTSKTRRAAVPIWEWERITTTSTSTSTCSRSTASSHVQAQGPRPVRRVRQGARPALAGGRAAGRHVARDALPLQRRSTIPTWPRAREFQFYHSVTKDDRAQIWFRPYEPPPEMPDEEYPFWLNTGRVLEHWHTGTMTRAFPSCSARAAGVCRDAPRRRARAGHSARRHGARRVAPRPIDLPVWINGRGKPPRGQVFVPFFDETS